MEATSLVRVGRDAHSFVALFLDGRTDTTVRAYQSDLADFARWAHVEVADAMTLLLGSGAGAANETVMRYRNDLSRTKKPNTVNRRIATLRSIVAFARTIGLIDWQLAVRGVKSEVYRDTRGPGVAFIRRMIHTLEARGDAKSIRDRAIVRLLFDCALRRAEVVSLDVEHIDLEGQRLSVLRKGRAEREAIGLPEPTWRVLKDWLALRGSAAGPLFTNFDRAGKGERLTAGSLYRLVRRLGSDLGRRVRPHALRHTAITAALEATGGDVRSVAKFSSHRSIQTVLRYDDERRDVGGEVARLVADSI